MADISCDIDGPVATTIQPSTIADPIYGYEPHAETVIDYKNKKAIAVMAVDNMPAELPRDASEAFGEMFIEHVLDELYKPESALLDRATICKNGSLTTYFDYIGDYVANK